ncbi:MAG TPA: hypothetical protein VKO42_02490 [Patescibacteria group bacterium]|nr:hypothetical protein [Patescibacteria group bacterium]
MVFWGKRENQDVEGFVMGEKRIKLTPDRSAKEVSILTIENESDFVFRKVVLMGEDAEEEFRVDEPVLLVREDRFLFGFLVFSKEKLKKI